MRSIITLFRRSVLLALLALLASSFFLLPSSVFAQAPEPAPLAEAIRTDLLRAQLALADEPAEAQRLLAEAEGRYSTALALAMAPVVPAADKSARAGFAEAAAAIAAGDAPGFAAARARVWTALLAGGDAAAENALRAGDAALASAWLPLREFRHATRFSRPDADATLAVAALAAGKGGAEAAVAALHADLLDTYQARLTEALNDAMAAERQGFGSRRAEAAALAHGYFAILAPAYERQRGASALADARRAFDALREAATANTSVAAAEQAALAALKGFRAAPLSEAEQARRAGQLLRFLGLVPVEYARGVSGGRVTKDLEIREATTFRDGAAAAFEDLRTHLEARDVARTARAAALFDALGRQLAAAGQGGQVASAGEVQANADELAALLHEAMPSAWQQRDSAADFDVISTALDQMDAAAAAGQYDLAESARLEAYAILESGPEAKLVVFAPQMKQPIEETFWYGNGVSHGLARLIADRAPATQVKATRRQLDAQLAEAKVAIGGQNAPVAVATNAAIIVFREGLEAVLILASLMGSLKTAAMRRYRAPMWIGAAAAFGFSALTWVMSRAILNWLLAFGINAEILEVIVSLIAIAVLLLITNWFFHQVYWTGWMASFHQHKKRLVGGETGKWIGLAVLGFSSIYREGFETVLFMQALVLESTTAVVLGGVALGLLATFAVGFIVFFVQAKLPHKKMLIVTGVMIGAVLIQMVGKTTHVMQVIGWLPIHPIRWLADLLPYWAGMWFGLYATWEGIGLQVFAGAFVIGSYYLAERINHRKPAAQAQAQVAATQA
jgi:high-affinity iron transporter